MMRVMVTGGAGFIGSHLIDRLLERKNEVICYDNFNDFYNPDEKRRNVAPHAVDPLFRLVEGDIRDAEAVEKAVLQQGPDIIVHLAARAGVRPSVLEPKICESVNVRGTLNVLEAAKKAGVRKFVFGSSSSVYGLNKKVPFSEEDSLLRPASPYAASKIAGEAFCRTYAHLYGIHVVSLRFFTVYGPRQRPDLAIRKFAEKILRGEEVTLYGDGSSARDYTYIDDIVQGIVSAVNYTGAEYDVFNLGNSRPVLLIDLIRALEKSLGREARIKWAEEQPGDVPITYANIKRAEKILGFQPSTSLEEGLRKFTGWLLGGNCTRHVPEGVG
ncbi:MAG TPA: GDP-mannose 4,6-dehydratase [Bacillota bacterium]|nr:GDP-mannose 4,6-dehydratase [Bacillota bacterium]